MGPDQPRWRTLAGVLVAVVLLFGIRVSNQPLQPYGSNAAEYIEHAVRLEVAALSASGPREWWARADATVLSHPPGLHAVTLPAHAVLGRSAEAVVWTGLGWHLLLALALAGCGWGLCRRRDAAVAAGIAGLLYPAGLAAATRYHYDLPMNALLWGATAVVLCGRGRAPVRSGVGAGALLALACSVKWTALGLGPVLLGATLWPDPRVPLSRAWVCAGTAALAGAAGVLGLLAISTESFHAGQLATGYAPSFAEIVVPRLGADRLVWYPLAGVFSLFSPAVVLAALPVLLAGWRAGIGRGFCATSTVWVAFALVAGVDVLDERFVLTAGPGVLLLGAIGAARAPRAGVMSVLALVLVNGEFHLSDGPSSEAWTLGESPALSPRGLWLGDTVERRGWSSRATTPDLQRVARADLARVLGDCAPGQLGYVAGLSDQGDTWWLRYRAALDGRPMLVLAHTSLGPRRFWWPDPDGSNEAWGWYRAGFDFDTIADPGAFAEMTDLEVALNLRALGLDPAAMDRFAPTVALTRIPPSPDSPVDASWRLHHRVEAAEPLGIHVRKTACPGPAYTSPPP